MEKNDQELINDYINGDINALEPIIDKYKKSSLFIYFKND